MVDRATVFHIAERAGEPLGAARTFVAAAVWGSGTGVGEVEVLAVQTGEVPLSAIPVCSPFYAPQMAAYVDAIARTTASRPAAVLVFARSSGAAGIERRLPS